MCLKKKVSNGLFLVSGSDDLQVYRYNEEKMLSWLQSKVCVMSLWHTFPIPSYLNQPSIGSQKDDPTTPHLFTMLPYIRVFKPLSLILVEK